ncbi:hypothetical protein J1614_009576 [Plenodomus biglobosus]|nr:hypothetical protein J1614_009576 [Plenodomus biglobosus]
MLQVGASWVARYCTAKHLYPVNGSKMPNLDGDSDLGDPRSDHKYEPFSPPAWLLDLAQRNATQSSASSDAFKTKIQEIKDSAKNKEGPNNDAIPSADLLASGPYLTDPVRGSDSRKQQQEQRREDRRGKKTLFRAQQVKEGVVAAQAVEQRENLSATKSEITVTSPPIVPESSRAGAAREALTNTIPATVATNIAGFFPSPHSSERYQIRPLPTWYTSISENAFEMKQLGRKKPQDLTALESLKGYIVQCQGARTPAALEKLYDDLRNEVHKAEIKLSVNKYILKKTKILSPDTGLPAIFKKDAEFPPDLKADSYQLYNRWYNQDFNQDILRGIITKAGRDRNNDSLDPKYRAEHPTSAKYHGEGNLVLGQWWPTQLCTVRDGAHGAPQAGSGGYHDVDNGTTILYSGTESRDSTPTENTSHLIKSIELCTPVRVLRSHQLPKSNKFRPEVGLRYDGLYQVKDFTLVDNERAVYRFWLIRCEGQDPIRCEEGAARRPTVFEEAEWDALKKRKDW